MTAVWQLALCVGGIQAIAGIRAALLSAEIEVFPLDAARHAGPGIVLFDRASESIRETIRELAAGGRRRVLAVATSLSALVGKISAWDLLRAGAADVVAWEDPAISAQSIAARVQRWREIDSIIASPEIQRQLVGQSPEWMAMLQRVIEAACFTQAPILITGESGTGKELIARLIHSLDRRRGKRDLVVLDCSTLVRELSGSEFFGHERGAFTGALSPREGAFALADSGTLFLDEVGELPPELQTQLLRVVQEHTFKRVGSNDWKHTNFRLVCATNRDIQEEVAKGRFRTDLYYRIAGVCCHLPPLRERVADIAALARHFISELAGDRVVPGIDETVLRWLTSREYRGNIRELRLVVARMLYRHTGPGQLSIGDIPEEDHGWLPKHTADWRDQGFQNAIARAIACGMGLKEIGRDAENTAEQIVLDQENGSIHLAALRLGVSDRALQLRRAARRSHTETNFFTNTEDDPAGTDSPNGV